MDFRRVNRFSPGVLQALLPYCILLMHKQLPVHMGISGTPEMETIRNRLMQVIGIRAKIKYSCPSRYEGFFYITGHWR